MPGPMGNGVVRINKIDVVSPLHQQLRLLSVVQSSEEYLANTLGTLRNK